MKRVSVRALAVLVLAAVVVLGLFVFVLEYVVEAEDWVTFSGSPHVYSSGNLSTGTVTDRDGTLLLENTDEGRVYAEDAELRTATMHLLGDREGYIPSLVLNAYTSEMIGYSKIGGLYNLTESDNTLTLTISAEVERVALEALDGRKGTIGVYNYETGEILCMVTSPTYDPDAPPDIEEDDSDWAGVYVNRFFSSTFVPGSIFKLVTLAAALEELDGVEDRTFTCTGSVDIEGDAITCPVAHGTMTLEEALANSCNCTFGQLAVELGAETLQAYADAFGITSSLSFDGVTTAAGNFDLSEAASSQVAWAGIGQYTDTINPCQYLTVLGVIAGGGKAATPYVVSSVKTTLGLTDYEAETTWTDQIISEETAATIAEYMHYGVETVYGADYFPGLSVCAKSGTAEVGGDAEPNAMFAGFVQDTDCPVAFIIVVENGGSGAGTCTSIAADVLETCAEVLGAE